MAWYMKDETNKKNVVRRLQVSKKKIHIITLCSRNKRCDSALKGWNGLTLYLTESSSRQAVRRTLQIRQSGERFRSGSRENASHQAFLRTLPIRHSGERFRSSRQSNASDQAVRRTLQIRQSGERFRSGSQKNASHQAFGRRL